VEFSYYPGCVLHSTAWEYDASLRAVCERLGIRLWELEDWNCCGATSAHSLNGELALLLPARNLVIAEQQGLDLLVPCAACYHRSKATAVLLATDPAARAKVEEVFEQPYEGRFQIRHLLEVLGEESTLQQLRERVQRPLTGLKAVSYYGCLLVRPPKVTGAANYEAPDSMDRILAVLGATPLPWSYKTDCCGVSLGITQLPIALEMSGKVLRDAKAVGAEAIIVACPLCQINLDSRQKQIEKKYQETFNLPIIYFTQLMGVAFGLDAKTLGLTSSGRSTADPPR